MQCHIVGVGSCLPPRVVTNEELGPIAGMQPRRIEQLFDVRTRHWSRGVETPDPVDGAHCSDLGAEAARRALADADLGAADVDTLVTVSSTPDVIGPSLDYLVGTKIGLHDVTAIDVRAGCAGLFRALVIVESLMKVGRSRTALVVAAEVMSPLFRFGSDVPKDQRFNTVLYGDGAGAIVVRAGEDDGGIDAIVLRTTGTEEPPGLVVRGMLSSTPPRPGRYEALDYLGYHDFRLVLARGSALAWRAADEILRTTGRTLDDYRYLVTHQATGRIKEIGARYGIAAEKLPTNIDRVGNTVSASILVLLDELHRGGRLASGDRLLLHTAESSTWSFGAASLTWGS